MHTILELTWHAEQCVQLLEEVSTKVIENQAEKSDFQMRELAMLVEHAKCY